MDENEIDGTLENTESAEEEISQEQPRNIDTDGLRILEALLFASDELLSPNRIKPILPGNPDARQIRKMVDKLNAQLQKERHPFEIVEIGGGYQFRTVSYYHPWVRQIFKEKAAKKLSVQALECLAIIAYKQPLSKAEIEAIRGVISDGAMKTLLEKRLVTIIGRSEKPGRPLLYGTTMEFLTYFGLNKIVDLPRIEEFEAIAREKMEELSEQELQHEEEVLTEEEGIASGESSPKGASAEVKDPTETFEVSVAVKAAEKQPPIPSEENRVSADEFPETIEVDIQEEESFEVKVEQPRVSKKKEPGDDGTAEFLVQE